MMYMMYVHGLGAAGADQLPSGLGVQADAGGWDSPRGGSKAAKHKKTRHPKLYGSLRKVQLSAGSNPVRTPTTTTKTREWSLENEWSSRVART